ncbi:MAG: glycine--tRNA ligase [Candidatus Kerfeldbacteria bacterium]|nr:glycine--tRNA ligase [Candidatus Kerfeldbacteria bacterium]
MEQVVNLAKRRGFVFPSAEIYGGLGGFWDWGPLGVLLKNNIKREWWKTFVQQRDDVVGIDGAIITNPKVWEASGHVKSFNDVLVECKWCKRRFKADDKFVLDEHIVEEVVQHVKEKKRKEAVAEAARKKLLEEGVISHGRFFLAEALLKELHGSDDRLVENKVDELLKGDVYRNLYSEKRQFNTMFKTFAGPAEDTASVAYLRPETAQNIFVNYELVRDTMRLKLPFGIAQIGKAFRNEITPGHFVFRSREFEQMEIEYFVLSGTDDEWFDKWVTACEQWFFDLGIKKASLRLRKQLKEGLAHYAKATTDIEYAFPIEKGWAELTGISNRQDYDLKQHGEFARKDAEAFATAVDDGAKVKKVPYVIEPSFGVDRAALAFLLDAYEEQKDRVVLKLHPKLAPYTVAVFPLLANKPQLVEKAREVFKLLQPRFMTAWDDRGNVGKRYYSQDEIGTPWCVTIDFDTLEGKKRPKGTVTVRDRDSMEQENVVIEELPAYLAKKLAA